MSGGRVKNDYSLIREYVHLNSLWSVWAEFLHHSSSLLINFNIKLFYNVTTATTAGGKEDVSSVGGEGSLVWPRIASSHTVSFPLTLIGNYTVSQYIISILLVLYMYIIIVLYSSVTDSRLSVNC